MNGKNVAIWTLSFAFIGALGSVPTFFVGQVMSGALLFAAIALAGCGVVHYRRGRRSAERQV